MLVRVENRLTARLMVPEGHSSLTPDISYVVITRISLSRLAITPIDESPLLMAYSLRRWGITTPSMSHFFSFVRWVEYTISLKITLCKHKGILWALRDCSLCSLFRSQRVECKHSLPLLATPNPLRVFWTPTESSKRNNPIARIGLFLLVGAEGLEPPTLSV